MLEFTKSEAKAWAKKNFKGLEVTMEPSFTPDMDKLDEEGIRWDVNYYAAQKMSAVFATCDTQGMTMEQRKQFLEIVNDEAKKCGLHCGTAISRDNLAQALEMIKHHEKCGGTSALVYFPPQYQPKDKEDIFNTLKTLCDATNMLIELYPTVKSNLSRFHPSGFPLDLVPRLAEIPNVVAAKIAGANMAQWHHLVGDQVLLASPHIDDWPVTIPQYGQQWAGAQWFDVYSQPDNPLVAKLFNLFVDGKFNEAMEIFWKLTPIRDLWRKGMATYLGGSSMMPVTFFKYCSWCNGGNGGLMPLPSPRLYDNEKAEIRASLKAGGLPPREAPDEEFIVGRVLYSKGARVKGF